MGAAEVLLGGLLVSVAVLAGLARLLAAPYPVVLVLGGAVLGFIPGLPHVQLNPDIVLLVFLPPLVYWAAVSANFRDMQRNLRTLTLSSVVLVLVTMVAVAAAAHWVDPELSWPAALALGAIVSPTDPLAAGLIMRRLKVPRQVISAAEGEGLFNDATALVAYRVAVAAILGPALTIGQTALTFVASAVGGIAIGLAVGWVIGVIRGYIADAQISLTISLLTGYAAFIPATAVGASGVLAVVAAGLYMGNPGLSLLPPRTRLQGQMVWDILTYLINASLFVLVGLQLSNTFGRLAGHGFLVVATLAVAATVILIRLAWFFTVPYLIRAIDRRPRQRARRVSAPYRLVLAWSGMRGSVSLAAALALPLATGAGTPFTARDGIIVLTFGVILATLVAQGLTLPALIRLLGITDEQADQREELHARLAATRAALAHIDMLGEQDWTRDDSVARLRAAYEFRMRRLKARAGKIADDEGYEDKSLAYQHMVRAVLTAQRATVIELRDQGTISNDVMNRIIQDFDLEETRLEI